MMAYPSPNSPAFAWTSSDHFFMPGLRRWTLESPHGLPFLRIEMSTIEAGAGEYAPPIVKLVLTLWLASATFPPGFSADAPLSFFGSGEGPGGGGGGGSIPTNGITSEESVTVKSLATASGGGEAMPRWAVSTPRVPVGTMVKSACQLPLRLLMLSGVSVTTPLTVDPLICMVQVIKEVLGAAAGRPESVSYRPYATNVVARVIPVSMLVIVMLAMVDGLRE